MKRINFFGFIFSLIIIASCGRPNSEYDVSVDNLKRVVKELSSDAYMGRMPFTKGEELSVEFLAKELEKIGFEPAFSGSYFQEVPMISIISEIVSNVSISLTNPLVKDKHSNVILSAPDMIALNSPLPHESVQVLNSPLVFCGFGVEAPEYDWNDFKDVDVKGKTIVVLINDPGFFSKDPTLFKGNEMTLYGRWTYKYEQAAKKGAAGIIIIHDTDAAGYGYNVPQKSATSSKLFIDNEDVNSNCKVTGWISQSSAKELLAKQGYSLDSLITLSLSREFSPIDLKSTISVSFKNKIERNISKNVAGILRGSKLPQEATLISGHWDHFGIGEAQLGDSIYNGAVDNGTTMAWVLEIGRVLANKKLDRSVVLFFPTAEEQGLVGSYYYVNNQATNIEKTVACLNNDMMVPAGRMKDVTMIGYGYSTLDSIYNIFASKRGRYLLPDPNSQTGLFFRSDHFPFFKAGIPSIWAMGRFDCENGGKERALEAWNYYMESAYHRPADNYDPNWDWGGIVQDTELALDVILWLSNKRNPHPVLL